VLYKGAFDKKRGSAILAVLVEEKENSVSVSTETWHISILSLGSRLRNEKGRQSPTFSIRKKGEKRRRKGGLTP